MGSMSVDFEFEGYLQSENWPEPGQGSIDYGYVIYKYDGKEYKDSGGYLTSYIHGLLDGLINKFNRNERYHFTSLDGDSGLIVTPSTQSTEVTVYSGTREIYKTTMNHSDFIHFCFDQKQLE